MQGNTQGLPESDNDLVRRLIANVKVVSADRVMIQFKSGIEEEELDREM